jgi:hypothetical protein
MLCFCQDFLLIIEFIGSFYGNRNFLSACRYSIYRENSRLFILRYNSLHHIRIFFTRHSTYKHSKSKYVSEEACVRIK